MTSGEHCFQLTFNLTGGKPGHPYVHEGKWLYLVRNSWRCKISDAIPATCDVCIRVEEETLIHRFYLCPRVFSLWVSLNLYFINSWEKEWVLIDASHGKYVYLANPGLENIRQTSIYGLCYEVR